MKFVDYPEYAVQVAQKIDQGDAELGILICGSGQGVYMTANKYNGVRADWYKMQKPLP